MANEKNSSDKPAAKKRAVKKTPAKKAAAKKNPVAGKTAVSAPSAAPLSPMAKPQKAMLSAAELYDEIRRRAYELYRERGGEHGSHEADWHRAESEVRAKHKS
jgi:type IV secretory pathway TrbL component